MYSVYFIRSGNKKDAPIKVGVTRNIDRRLRSLQCGNPWPLVCVGMIPCYTRDEAFKLERYIHRSARANRMQGEWFRGNFNLKRILKRYNGQNETDHAPIRVRFRVDTGAEKLEQENKELRETVKRLEAELEEAAELTRPAFIY